MLLMAKRDNSYAFGLRHAREIGNGNAGDTKDGVDAVELQGIDDEMKAVGHLGGVRVVCHIKISLHLSLITKELRFRQCWSVQTEIR